MFGIEKVKINKTAWHYRWLTFLRFISEGAAFKYVDVYDQKGNWVEDRLVEVRTVRAPKSICPYFWMLIFSFVLVLIATSLVLTLIGAIGFGIYKGIELVIAYPVPFMKALLIVLGAIAMPIAIIAYVPKLERYLSKRHPKKIDKRYYEEKKPKTGLFYVVKNYVQAKKSKVCPLIEFVD